MSDLKVQFGQVISMEPVDLKITLKVDYGARFKFSRYAIIPIDDYHANTISYCGEQGEENMKAEIKEIMHACGDSNEFTRICNEAQAELDEYAFDLDQESRMNGV